MNDTNFASFLYYSDDSASTWQVVDGGELSMVNECTFARRHDGKILYMSRAQDTQHGANPITTNRIAYSLYSADLKTNSALAPVEGIASPVCEGSLVASTSTGRFYFSNPSSRHWRGNLTIHSSSDGIHWDGGQEIWGTADGHNSNSGYSALVDRGHELGLLFEGGVQKTPVDWPDTFIRFARVPYNFSSERSSTS